MQRGLFQVICPSCGEEVLLSGIGQGWCSHCRREYLVRRGHLIAVGDPGAAGSPGSLAPGQTRLP
jgi:hypothetical protein